MNKLVAVKEGSAVGVQSEAAAIFSMIERVAAQPEVPVERVEHLFRLYTQMDAERARRSFRSAFAKMQPALPAVERKGKSHNGKSARWEDIAEVCMPVLAAHGFGLSFRLADSGQAKINVTCILSHEDGHSEECSHPFPYDTSGGKNAIQSIGSAKTYGQRYTATALLGIATRDEDDDGKAAGDAFSVDTISDDQFKVLAGLIKETNSTVEAFCEHIKVASLSDILASKFDAARGILLTKKKKLAEKKKMAETVPA